jgi:predicted lipase
MLLKYLGFDNRDCIAVDNSELDETILTCMIASELAYLNPDIYFDKWDAYKLQPPSQPSDNSYYSIRENLINTFFYGIETKPIFYDGKLNEKVTRDSQAYIAVKNNIAYVSFRGTDDIFDILTDINVYLTSIKEEPDVKVHKGFYLQFLALKDWILADLKKLAPTKIILTGHSLAGATSTIASAILSLDKSLPEITCITFGSPRIGNRHFKEFFNANVKNHYRVTNTHDPVPLLPFLPYYEHVSEAYHLQNSSIFKQVGDLYWGCRLINFVYDLRKPIYYHSYDLYIQNILKLTTKSA